MNSNHTLLVCTAAIVAALSFSGCAFAPVSKPTPDKYGAAISNVETFSDARSNVFRAANAASASLGYAVNYSNESSGSIETTPKQVITPRVCDCGKWNGADVAGTADSVLQIQVSPDGERTTVRLTHACSTKFTGKNLYGMTTRVEAVQCASVGDVEKRFWAATREALVPASASESVQQPVARRHVVAPKVSAALPLKTLTYPAAAKKRREQGIVGLRLYVLEDGKVADAKVEVSTGFPDLDNNAVALAKREWKLIPGTIDGRPTPMWAAYALNYSLYIKEIPKDQSRELRAQGRAYEEYLDQLEREAERVQAK